MSSAAGASSDNTTHEMLQSCSTDVREDLLAHRKQLQDRIARLPSASKPLAKHPDPERKETHWDFLLKEMMWMSTDFDTERKRHFAMLKQRSKAIMGYWRHKESEERHKVRLAASDLDRETPGREIMRARAPLAGCSPRRRRPEVELSRDLSPVSAPRRNARRSSRSSGAPRASRAR